MKPQPEPGPSQPHNRRGPAPVITAGDVEYGVWCGNCREPSRIRVHLHLSPSPHPAAFLEFCVPCGTGWMPARTLAEVIPAPRVRRPPLAAVLWWFHVRASRRAGRQPLACAFRECQRPGWHNCVAYLPVDFGRYRLVFCSRRHRHAWTMDRIRGLG